MTRTGRALVLCVFVLSALIVPAPTSSAAETFEISVGKLLSSSGERESMRFFPDDLKIHQGDTLHFTSDGFHSATLLPLGQDATQWMEAHWEGRSHEWSLVQADADDGAGAIKLNPLAAMPSRIDCGQTGQPPCAFDGEADPVEGVMNSGLPGEGPLDFTVTITAAPGETMWAVDLVAGMTMRIDIVSPDEPASTEQQISDANASQTQTDTATANRLHRTYSKKREKTTKRGRTTWKAYAGVDGNGVVLRAMYPKALPIRKGDSVQWLFNKLVLDAHTVTFPATQARTILDQFPEIACDPDGDGAGPDNPQEQPSPSFCDDPRHVEFDVPNDLVAKRGGSSISSAASFAHSGVRGASPLATSKAAYKLRFTKGSGKRGFSYACALHPTMTGKVVVK